MLSLRHLKGGVQVTTMRAHAYREWSRYQWASIDPAPDEHSVPRWNLVEWVGDQGVGVPAHPVAPDEMSEGDAGPSGYRHNPGGNHWAEGYHH